MASGSGRDEVRFHANAFEAELRDQPAVSMGVRCSISVFHYMLTLNCLPFSSNSPLHAKFAQILLIHPEKPNKCQNQKLSCLASSQVTEARSLEQELRCLECLQTPFWNANSVACTLILKRTRGLKRLCLTLEKSESFQNIQSWKIPSKFPRILPTTVCHVCGK